ncbi:hypothetical protein HFP15_17100 [Amycolatopsis sp. K13G38]|uniref:Uncharacterized protein n=1 Tax=Amycolatopsis acididurans TaxID=2724524 RepID=A0ABX1J898_9PSEU|nr:hypothetical protein [Amycolatopsis acididurans]NKQ54601.1 hypothetical protein [Amycolatopsis acididurans]
MMNLLIFLAVLGLVLYGLERNHRRQRPARMNGSVNFEDRDIPRAHEELHAIPVRRLSRGDVRLAG